VYKLVIFDMDGVLVDCGSSWVVVHDHFGVNYAVSLDLFLKEEIDDLEFMRRDIVLWKEQDEHIHINLIRKILGSVSLIPGAKDVFTTLKKHGIKTAIVSGGIDILAERVAEEVECDLQVSNGLVVDREGFLTGEGVVRVPVLKKDMIVRRIQEKFGIDKDKTVSLGNSQVDVQMFKQSDLGIAFCPEDEKTRENADVVVEERDLTKVLELIL